MDSAFLIAYPVASIILIFLVITLIVALVQIGINASNNRTKILCNKLRLEEKRVELEILRLKAEQ